MLSRAHYHRKLPFARVLPVLPAIIIPIAILFITVIWTKADLRELTIDLVASTARIAIAYLVCLVLAVPVSIWVASHAGADKFMIPIFDVLESFPGLAILPLLIAFFGPSEFATIVVLILDMVWPLMFALVASLKTVSSELSDAATIFGAKGWDRIWFFTIPAVLPSLVTGSIVSFGQGWQVIVGAEIIGTSSGIGGYIVQATNANNSHAVIAGFVILLVSVFLINRFIWVRLLESSTKYQTE